MPDKSNSNPITKVERDTNLFVWFMTLVITGMYALSLYNHPSVRQAKILFPLTVFVLVHIILHWQLGKITTQPSKILWYTIIQGILAFLISWLGNETGLAFALFMALIGETVGIFGLSRQGLSAGIYYLILLAISMPQISGRNSSGSLLVMTIPMVIFVVIYVTLYMRQNEAREQAEALASELEIANRQLAEYAAQVEDLTIAGERQRMARELHDTLSQGLAGLILQLEAADAHLTDNRTERAQSIIGNAMEQARVTLADARRAIDDLRQSPLDDLDSALRREIDRFTTATGIAVRYDPVRIPPMPETTKETFVRALVELLTNIANHAQARFVEINLEGKGNNLFLAVKDDGIGFDTASIPSGHYGILGIKERVRLVNGQVEIRSEKGRGTTINIQAPI